MPHIEHYATLGVPRDAGTATITKPLHKLARKSHIDMKRDKDAEVRFKAVAEAYAVLNNPYKRADCDNPPAPPSPCSRYRAAPTESNDVANLLATFRRVARGEASGAFGFRGMGESGDRVTKIGAL
jgi:curved DNA-binding protein